jgi:hypothetical protein
MAGGAGTLENIRRKFARTHELIFVSYHEAGHAVYGLLHTMMIGPVYVFESKREKRIWGMTHFESILDSKDITDPDLISERLHSEICMQYAGLTAEKYHYKTMSGSDKFPMNLKYGSESDTSAAAVLIKQFNLAPPGRKRYAYKKKLIKETLHELQDNWDDVTLVAHALFNKKRLGFSELRDLLTKKSKNKSFWKEQFKTINYIFDNRDALDEKDLKSILSI